MKNILLLVHDDEGQEARLQAALDLTRTLDGHLRCVDVTQLPVTVGDYYGIAGETMLVTDERQREAINRDRLEARLQHESVAWDWIDVAGDIASCVVGQATMADLVVLNRKLDAIPGPETRDIAGRVLMRARKPIVAVPDALRRFDARGRALIAWDGRDSAAATMRACVPLLQFASAVHIFAARDGAERIDAGEAAAYLSRHGIHASVRIVDDGFTAADRLIVAEGETWRADYILMGAYGRGRLMETFGGVTRRMLGSSPLPLILGH